MKNSSSVSFTNLIGCALLGFCIAFATATAQETASPRPPEANLVFPDGTPIVLRFARPLYGSTQECPRFWQRCDSPRLVKIGENIRLIVAANVVIDNHVVIAKGAAAQAHIHSAYLVEKMPWSTTRSSQPFDPGFSLMLDWAETVNGDRVPLRAEKKGKPHWFTVRIIGTKDGVEVLRNTGAHDLGWIYTGLFRRETYHAKTWIPAGSRITGYVHGNVGLVTEEIERAQESLPARNPLALLTVYRGKGSADQPVKVTCDSAELGALRQHEYLTSELGAGEHSCRAEDNEPIKFRMNAGDELYLRLERQAVSGTWGLKLVPAVEGEDGIAKASYFARE